MRMVRIAANLFMLTAFTVGAVYVVHKIRSPLTAADPAPSLNVSGTPLPEFALTVMQVSSAGRRLALCRGQQCQTKYPPPAAAREAVTDGSSWYHYEDGALMKTPPDGSPSTKVTEKTPLVTPRGLFISPDTNKVAFWLDNIDVPREQLTELWVYDAAAGGTKLLAEKVFQPDVLTLPRWNRSATHLWFIGNTSEAGEPSQPELLVVSLNPPAIASSFIQLDWRKLTPIAGHGPLDISPDGEQLAYAEAKTRRTSTLITVGPAGQAATTVRGRVVYLQWFEDNSLLYAVQDEEGITFWRLKDLLHRHIVHHAGQLQSVHADRQGRYATFAVQSGQQIDLFTADTASGQLINHAPIPHYSTFTLIIRADPLTPQPRSDSPESALDDAVLANVIEQHLPDIARLPAARPQRLIITDQANTVYVDFADHDNLAHRLLIIVYDATQPAWSIKARYREASGEWVKTQGEALSDPRPLRLYEWESNVKQWILKDKLE